MVFHYDFHESNYYLVTICIQKYSGKELEKIQPGHRGKAELRTTCDTTNTALEASRQKIQVQN